MSIVLGLLDTPSQMNVVSLYLVLEFISKTYDVYMKLSINKCILLLIFHYELAALVQL